MRQPPATLNIIHGVDGGTVVINGKMKMGTCGPAGAAHIADDLTLGDILPGGNHIVGHMPIQAGIAVAMVDGDIVAVDVAVCSRGHGAAAGGINWRALRRAQAPVTGCTR